MFNPTQEASKYQITIKMDGLPPTLNKLKRMHHMAEARLNDEWRGKVKAAIGSNIPPEPITRARITITRHSSVEGDGDNYTGGYKAICDTLGPRYLKILREDRMSNIGN